MKVVEKVEMTVIGIKITRDWKGLIRDMPLKWEEFKSRLVYINQRKSDVMMDISLEEKNTMYTQCICVEVPYDAEIPEGMEKITIPSARYLHHNHVGSLASIAETFGKMYQYGKESGLDLDTMKIDMGYTTSGNESTHDLYIKLIG